MSNHLGCVNEAAAVIGSKWSAQILREFSRGPKHFCELERALPSVNPVTLTKRLDELRDRGIITRLEDEGYSAYDLTQKGKDLLPILKKMAEWGEKYPRDSSWNVA